MTKTMIIVPARLASQRFPRKLLFPIHDKPLILWTAERIQDQAPELPLAFAVGDRELADTLEAGGFQAIMTNPDLASGTDRIAEANETLNADIIINVQADEPLVTAAQLQTLHRLIQSGVDMATLARPFENAASFRDPNRVKVVCRADGQALYFSRAPIPLDRNGCAESLPDNALLHLGLYAYSADFLRRFVRWPEGRLEKLEKLEQLRALENGASIAVGITRDHGVGIDTPEDAKVFEKLCGR